MARERRRRVVALLAGLGVFSTLAMNKISDWIGLSVAGPFLVLCIVYRQEIRDTFVR